MALYQVPTENALQYTLDSQLSAGGSSLTLNTSVAGVVQAPGIAVIDRIDSAGNATASKREYVTFTGVSGADLTGLARGLAGSTDQVHSVGAIVEFVPDILWAQAIYDWATLEHETGGAHVSLPSIQYINFPAKINPVWYLPALQSGPSVGIGRPLKMPTQASLQWVAVTLHSAISSASLVLDINNGGTSIFDTGTRPGILGGGTFVSTASIKTKTITQGNEFTVDLDNGGNAVDATIQFSAR